MENIQLEAWDNEKQEIIKIPLSKSIENELRLYKDLLKISLKKCDNFPTAEVFRRWVLSEKDIFKVTLKIEKVKQ